MSRTRPSTKYTGQVDDSTTENESGLMYYNARYYDPAIGRFISADSEIPDARNSQAFNRYMYVAGNPVKFGDYDGHKWGSGFFKKVASAVSGVASSAWNAVTHPVSTAKNLYNKAENGVNKAWNGTKGTVGSGDWWGKQWNDWMRDTLLTITISIIVVVSAATIGLTVGAALSCATIALSCAAIGASGGLAFAFATPVFLTVMVLSIIIGTIAGYYTGKIIGGFLVDKSDEYFGTHGYLDKDDYEKIGAIAGGGSAGYSVAGLYGFIGFFYQWYIIGSSF